MKTYLCLDVGGTNTKAALILSNGKINHWESTPTKRNKIENTILTLVTKLLAIEPNCSAISLAYPYPINISLSPNKIKKIIIKKFAIPVYLNNDANLFTLYEATLGVGRKYQNVVGITLGTGVGGGLCLNKIIYQGKKNALEIGHTTINFPGPKCRCGQTGCWEQYIGSQGIKKLCLKYKLANKSGEELYSLAKQKNKQALNLWHEYGQYLGIGMVNIINNFDPDIIVLGGGTAQAFTFFRSTMLKTITKRSFLPIPLMQKSNQPHANLIGAMLFAKQN